MENEKIQKAFEVKKFKRVLEIGSGSGRTCDAILSIEKNFKYISKKIISKQDLFSVEIY